MLMKEISMAKVGGEFTIMSKCGKQKKSKKAM